MLSQGCAELEGFSSVSDDAQAEAYEQCLTTELQANVVPLLTQHGDVDVQCPRHNYRIVTSEVMRSDLLAGKACNSLSLTYGL